ncbi:rhomboid family intramembrane serine protease [Psychrobacillus sp. NEAU-3TGS]|uniref:rhomboid family intramembrane serine protease n=1 Tax=Psychrobacillus sp. NEAU-3TGS TaxID=2995412 RepID=UPI0024987F79|nr:rhomboid family intramembrane serine protease [Psychrobacillus sp. NEAU-3TGS]MDI2586040.1 rhomboid family intramembrane serine protease [Psychrobacillus sp. NEAU-3TGS]
MFTRTENFKQYIKFYPVVSTLLAINIVIYILTNIPVLGDAIYSQGVHFNLLISEGEYWRLVTPLFLHATFFHLLFNMFSLYLFGPELEQIAGKARFLTIYLLAGLVGSIATYLIHDWNYVSVGASGAIYGILGAFGALVYYTRNLLPQLKQIIVPIIVIGVIMTFLQPNINATAHIAGLITGFIFGIIYFHPKRIAAWRKRKSKLRAVK